ncbi:MAG: O-methyltransferase [Deltaproteobacteria bacterium]|nr:MAG: O-methyltransferase [Deltaproteobacteria bacterium]
MSDELISKQVKNYLDSLVPARPTELEAMELYAKENGFPIIGAACGYFCYQMARMINAKHIFELGSGYGYSTAWFAQAVKENGGGAVHHVVWDDGLSKKAQAHLAALGLGEIVQYHVGEAVQSLREMPGQFDLIFNDIDKHGYPDALPVIKEKLGRGGVLIVDNMLWGGSIFDDSDHSPDTQGIREFTRQITSDPTWIVTLVPIRDGLGVAFKK